MSKSEKKTTINTLGRSLGRIKNVYCLEPENYQELLNKFLKM